MSINGGLPILEVIDRVEAELCSLGFVRSHQSPSGSRYLHLREEPDFDLRLSDRDNNKRDNYPNLLHSVWFKQPKQPGEIQGIAFAIAIRFTAILRDRKGLVREHAA